MSIKKTEGKTYTCKLIFIKISTTNQSKHVIKFKKSTKINIRTELNK